MTRNSDANRNSFRPGLSDEEAERRHREIRQGLALYNTATMVAFGISVLLAMVAVWAGWRARQHATAAQAATVQATESLWHSQLAQARALRWSGKVGRRQEGLEAIRQAVGIQPSTELRDEAIATLALIDLGPGEFWQAMPPETSAVDFSPAGAHYAWGDGFGQVRVFRTSDRAELGSFAVSNCVVMSLTFSPDDRFLAARFAGGAVRVWQLPEARVVYAAETPLEGFNEHSLRFHPREPKLVLSALPRGIQVVDLETRTLAATMDIQGAVSSLRFNADGSRLALAVGGRIEIWDFIRRERLQEVDASGAMTDLAWHPGEDLLAAAHGDGNITLIDRRTGRRQRIDAHTMVVTRVAFDPAGEVLVSTSWDGTTRLWDARSGRPLLTTQEGYALGFSASGKQVFYFKERLGLGVWQYDAASGFARLVVPIGNSDRILGVDFSPDSRWLAGTTSEGLHLWHRGTHEHKAFVPLADAQRSAFFANGRSLVVTTGRGLYRVQLTESSPGRSVALGTPELLPETKGQSFWLGTVTHGPQKRFASAASSQVVAVCLDDSLSLTQYNWAGPRRALAVSPDGQFLAASVWKGGGTHVWDTALRRQVASLSDEGGLVWFSPDGNRLAVGASTEFVFYDTRSWECLERLPRDAVSALSGILAFRHDGGLMALTHGVRQARIMNATASAVVANLHPPHTERITDLAFSPDGNRLAAATDNREIQLWDLEVISRELAALGLNWDRDAPGPVPVPTHGETAGTAIAAAGPLSWQESRALWLSGTGACLAGLFAFYSLRHHRRLIRAYAHIEAAATKNRQELKTAQAQLFQSEKMKALGTLAAGIAHDFNNLLSVIRMAGQLVKRELKPEGNAQQNLEDIEQAALQGKHLVRSILGYSRQPADPNSQYHVNAVVGETLAMLSKPFLSGIVLTLELSPEAPAVQGDKSRLEQILLNLIVNASEAMRGAGKLTLSLRARAEGQARILAPRPAPAYVELTVSDSGPGIAPDVFPRIFDPFFTTKQSGSEHGTGLGLTTVHNIAQQDGLGLDVETVMGQGTVFRVLLPASEASEAAPK